MSAFRTPALLVIMDGFGLSPEGPNNAISLASLPYFDSLMAKYPNTTLGASGEDVGLPAGQMGNSEVGHLNIGAGRIVFQELSRINNALKDGSLLTNETLVGAMNDVQNNNACLHIMGLVSDGGVHSSYEHAKALLHMAAQKGVQKIRLDAFTDGRDVAPQSGLGFLTEMQKYCAELSAEFGVDCKIATVSGRYFAMDRDNRWERIEKAYRALVMGEGLQANNLENHMEAAYEADPRGDEFIEPCVIEADGMHDGDAVVFFNFRPDRAREISRALTDKDFDGFNREVVPALSHFVTMTEYDPELDVEVAFPKTIPDNVLADVLSEKGLKQLHTAETEKYAHVTFFFNGGKEEPKPGEERVLVPSPKVATYDMQPEMSAPEVTEKLVAAIEADAADFYVVNYANCDMVGHTGDVNAAVCAAESVDKGLSEVVPAILKKGGFALLTADHGNADHMFDEVDGVVKPFTAHTTSRVPLVVVDDKETELSGIEDGCLSDLAPTILHMMGIEIPEQMNGRVLVK